MPWYSIITFIFTLDNLSYVFCYLNCQVFKKIFVKILYKIFFCPTTYVLYSRTWGLCRQERLNYPTDSYFDFEYVLAQTEHIRLEVIWASALDLYLFVNYGSIGWNALKTDANEIQVPVKSDSQMPSCSRVWFFFRFFNFYFENNYLNLFPTIRKRLLALIP